MSVWGIFKNLRNKIIKKRLTMLYAETMRHMVVNTSLRSAINESMKKQVCILETDTIPSCIDGQRFSEASAIKLLNARTITAAEIYKDNSTCVLNFACSVEPGGGVLVGSVAQEESLCRCSTLYPCLCSPEMYEQFYLPHIKSNQFLGTNDCIYTPDVIVFQTDDFYPCLRSQEEWFYMNVITCSAPALNHTNLYGESLYDLHYNRLIRILDVAANQNADVVILGAFGCGAFLNDPHIVSEAMLNVVKRYRFMFKSIVFAIPATLRENANYSIFQKAIDEAFSINAT